MKKDQLKVYLPRDLIKEFREFIATFYGTHEHGMISFEVEQALRCWLSTHKGAQIALTNKSANPTPNVFIVREAVKRYLQERFGYDSIYKVPKQQVIEAISAVRGTDERTIKKWIRLFEKFHVLKWITPNVVEFV